MSAAENEVSVAALKCRSAEPVCQALGGHVVCRYCGSSLVATGREPPRDAGEAEEAVPGGEAAVRLGVRLQPHILSDPGGSRISVTRMLVPVGWKRGGEVKWDLRTTLMPATITCRAANSSGPEVLEICPTMYFTAPSPMNGWMGGGLGFGPQVGPQWGCEMWQLCQPHCGLPGSPGQAGRYGRTRWYSDPHNQGQLPVLGVHEQVIAMQAQGQINHVHQIVQLGSMYAQMGAGFCLEDELSWFGRQQVWAGSDETMEAGPARRTATAMPNQGLVMELPSQYSHAWVSRNGEVTVADDPDFDPNAEVGSGGEWFACKRADPATGAWSY